MDPADATRDQEFRVTPQLVFGLCVIAAGVLFTLDNLDVIDADQYLRYWPVVLILIGALKLSQARGGPGSVLGGSVFTVAGIWLLLEELALIRISFWELWPLLLVLFGSYLVWQGVSQRPRVRGADSEAAFSALAVLGAVTMGNNSRAFRSADLTAVMGGCEIDLREAAIHGDAVIDVFVLWGGIEIRVPQDWAIKSQVMPVMGGVDVKARPPRGAVEHRLTIRGIAIMGGVEVKN